MFNTELDKDFVERALRFANLREGEMTSAPVVEAMFEGHRYRQERALLWRAIPDPNDVAGLKTLRDQLRDWLRIIEGENWEEIGKVRAEVLRRYKEKSTERARIDFETTGGTPGHLDVSLWGLPNMDFDDKGQLVITVVPLLTGVESAVYFAVLLIFTATEGRSIIGKCDALLPKEARQTPVKTRCENFFIRTRERWAACSDECNKLRRRAQINEKVRDYWKAHPRSKKGGGKEQAGKSTGSAKRRRI